ncbi:hypothetical protein L596_017181 [Steinernema carpocapsae]|uniref:Uncharacterized protein n=1 Tax=Steinernema carpocapsae TaxID=34508 RepID=A0A4U5N188_STECR|nr:hypothetical protein L596_017181 [Steinernema carpocapsae]
MDKVPFEFRQKVVRRFQNPTGFAGLSAFERTSSEKNNVYRDFDLYLDLYVSNDGTKFAYSGEGFGMINGTSVQLTLSEFFKFSKRYWLDLSITVHEDLEDLEDLEMPISWQCWDSPFFKNLILHFRDFLNVSLNDSRLKPTRIYSMFNQHPFILNKYGLVLPGQPNDELKQFLRFQFKHGSFQCLTLNELSSDDKEWMKEVLEMFFASSHCFTLYFWWEEEQKFSSKLLFFATIWANYKGVVAPIGKDVVPSGLDFQWDSSQLERKEDKSETLVFHTSNPNRKLRWSHFAPTYLSFEDFS